MISEADLAQVVGRHFAGGEYTVEPYVNWLVTDIVEDEHRADGTVHPLLAYIASLLGKGISLDELFALCGASADDGPMFGEHETILHRPLELGVTYRIAGAFTSTERKHGQKTGTFDIVGFELTVTHPDGSATATIRNSFVFPRRAAA